MVSALKLDRSSLVPYQAAHQTGQYRCCRVRPALLAFVLPTFSVQSWLACAIVSCCLVLVQVIQLFWLVSHQWWFLHPSLNPHLLPTMDPLSYLNQKVEVDFLRPSPDPLRQGFRGPYLFHLLLLGLQLLLLILPLHQIRVFPLFHTQPSSPQRMPLQTWSLACHHPTPVQKQAL